MAVRKPLFLDELGFPTEMSPLSDSAVFNSITVSGTGGIVLVSGTVTGVPNPTADDHVANKAYVDTFVQGLDIKASVRVATSSGVGTFNAVGGANGNGQLTGAPAILDLVVLADGDRILVKNQSSALENGLYVATSTTTTWDRASDFDEDDEVTAGSFVFVTEGNLQADTGWVVTSDDPIVVNTDAVNWTEFTRLGQIVAGDGLTKTSNTLNVGGGAGIVANTDDVAIELHTVADAQGTGADGGSSGLEFDQTGVNGLLRVKVDPAGGIQRGASGILLELDDTPNTLDVDSDGLKVVGLPLNFLINDVTTSGTVTAANLNELTLGGVTSLHQHAGVSDAQTVKNSYNVDSNVTAGDPVYFSDTDEVSPANANNNTAYRLFGVAVTTETTGNPVEVVSVGEVPGVLSGASPGQIVYLANGGGLTLTRPTAAGSRIIAVGTAMNATDLFVDVTKSTQLA